ncbi:tail fiber protein [Hymenobacter ginsengisoli]|uniref:Tail fiber protein n=1 Tax=Hymenobacter ginsengisoli TaxID=1051626 RepID=A0ABP8QJG2_9BACT|nr:MULTISPECIES: tail fiber protein [unclassified Hymenobacter]MBO2029970.1 tail fiber protein [Hymenobacter sp. BT559]
MSTAYIGEIRSVAFARIPSGWAPCNGQSLQISEYETLFSLIGTAYGGDGYSTFNVPDLRGRLMVGSQGGAGGGGLSTYQLGQQAGAETVGLTSPQMPQHQHSFSGMLGANSNGPSGPDPTNQYPGPGQSPSGGSKPIPYAPGSDGSTLNAGALAFTPRAAGDSQAHNNLQPVQALYFIIATSGLYPPRP